MEEHYYSKKPKSAEKRKNIEIDIKRFRFNLITSSGVFGKNKADKGTLLLIENALITKKKGIRVLDLGCGYGIVGIAIKKIYPYVEVVCSDVNERAVKLAKENSLLNDVEIDVLQSDIFESINGEFDIILVNLPQNAGKNICFKMIEESFKHLNSGGSLQVVSRHQKGGKMYEKKLIEVFGNCDYIGKGSGYRIYMSKKE